MMIIVDGRTVAGSTPGRAKKKPFQKSNVKVMFDPSPQIQCWVYIECSDPCEIKAVLCLTLPRRHECQH